MLIIYAVSDLPPHSSNHTPDIATYPPVCIDPYPPLRIEGICLFDNYGTWDSIPYLHHHLIIIIPLIVLMYISIDMYQISFHFIIFKVCFILTGIINNEYLSGHVR